MKAFCIKPPKNEGRSALSHLCKGEGLGMGVLSTLFVKCIMPFMFCNCKLDIGYRYSSYHSNYYPNAF